MNQAMKSNNTLVCCGLDPDVSKMPIELRRKARKETTVRKFLEAVVDITAPHVCAYKAQKAFFDILKDKVPSITPPEWYARMDF